MCVILVEDLVQLPPVQVESLWVVGLPRSKIDDRNGWYVFNYFNDTAVLKESNQLDETDPDSVEFKIVLKLEREGKIIEEARENLTSKYSMYRYRKF